VCGRYTLATTADELVEAFDVPPPTFDLVPRYNIAPSQDVPVVAEDRHGRRVGLLAWGLVPGWVEEPGSGIINARSESVADKPSFREAFERRRCLVPADGFYEWKKSEGARQPWFVRARSGEPLAFAGLWELWDAKGVELRLQTCTIITTRANAFMAHLHARMPAVLQADAREAWLDADTPASELLGLLQPRDDDSLEAWPVSRKVNSPFNEAPELIEPWRPRANRVGD
jgi:putative SOS response-associated peptidase YedK